jgi:cytochrome c biogenesis protein
MAKSNKPENIINKLWRFFSSVKLSVVILLSIAATSIIGTIIPQNATPNSYRNYYGQWLYDVFNTIDLLDIYHSWWFQLLLWLLVVNIIVCSANRLTSTWKIIFPKTPVFNTNQFSKTKYRKEWVDNIPLESIKPIYLQYISNKYACSRIDETNDGVLLFAEKRRWTHLGVYAVHFSILLIVIGSLIGSIFGFDGYVNLPVGESTNKINMLNKNMEKVLNFSLRCDDFNISLYDSGMPKEYRSRLSVIKKNQVIVQKDIIVNDPLRFNGVNIFQSSYGKTPDDHFSVIFTDTESNVEYKKAAVAGQPVETPDKEGMLIFEGFQNSMPYMGHTIENVFVFRLIEHSGGSQHIIIPVNFPQFDRMRKGKFIISVSDVVFNNFTGLQVTKDPGVPLVYSGFILMIIGCYITFFMYHEKICIELIKKNKSTRIVLSGKSLKERPGMQSKINQLANHLKQFNESKTKDLS